MTLLELTEPIFQYICRLNRAARKGASPDADQIRAEIKGILGEVKARAAAQPGLSEQYNKVELAILGFIDFMIKEAGRPFSKDWKELAHERNELAMDEKFFDLLEETLRDPSEAASERLGVYYTCTGLGFTGWYTGQPEFLRKKMLEMSARLRGVMEADRTAKICPEAYDKVNTADLVQPPGRAMVGVGIATLGLLIVVFAASGTLYLQQRSRMNKTLDNITSGAVAPRALTTDSAGKEGSR